MDRTQVYKVRELLSTGDIIAREENEYRLTDKAVIKLINEIERLQKDLQIAANNLERVKVIKIVVLIEPKLPEGMEKTHVAGLVEWKEATKLLNKLQVIPRIGEMISTEETSRIVDLVEYDSEGFRVKEHVRVHVKED